MKKAIRLVIVCALTMVLLAACGKAATDTADTSTATDAETTVDDTADTTADTTESEGSVFKIGGIGPATGGVAVYGLAVKNGAQLAVDEINAAGGINGVEFTHDALIKYQTMTCGFNI